MDERIPVPPLANVAITTQTNTKGAYNASGNARVTASIPVKSDAPNYCEDMINSQNVNEGVLKMFLELMLSKDFICDRPPSTDLTPIPGYTDSKTGMQYDANPVLNLKEELDKSMSTGHQWHTWNLNYNRNYDQEEVKKVVAHIMAKLNSLIDYVITNDVKKPDDEFRARLVAIFKSPEGKIYSFAHNTLILPAIVNYIAMMKNKHQQHASRSVGMIKGGSGLFTKTGNNSFANETKWKPSGERIAPGVIAPYCIVNKGVQQLHVGAYNYPLCEKMKGQNDWKPSTQQVKDWDPALLKNVTLPAFENDKYKYVDPSTDESFAVTTGNRTEPQPVYSGRKVELNEFRILGPELIPTCVAQPELHKKITASW